jgi:hypothetical protein
MNRKLSLLSTLLLVGLVVLLPGVTSRGQAGSPQAAQAELGSAFNYQGRLFENNIPANGSFDFTFKLFVALNGGAQVGPTVSRPGLLVRDGTFTARLDFGTVFSGDEMWLEVAVRPGGSTGAYTNLVPRQALAPVPYALFSTSTKMDGDGSAATAARSDHTHIDETWTGSGSGSLVITGTYGAPYSSPLVLGGMSGDALTIPFAQEDGVSVDEAGRFGVFVDSAIDGVHVGNALFSGLAVSQAANGVTVYSAFDGLYVADAADDGLVVNSAGGSGVEIGGAGANGVHVGSAGNIGVNVDYAVTGFELLSADNGLKMGTILNNGIEISSAGANGMRVESSGETAISIQSAGGHGIFVDSTVFDGIVVSSPGGNGFTVGYSGQSGLYVHSSAADGLNVAGNNYAGSFFGDIFVLGSCIGCAQAIFAVNASADDLLPGQVVSIQGITYSTLDNAHELWRVAPLEQGGTAIGVVSGRAELDIAAAAETLREGETGERLVPREGPAGPGEYLSILIFGPAQVKADPSAGAIQPGMRLATGEGGLVRPLRTVTVEGVELAESAPTLGIALNAPDEQGLVWVLVNPR